MAIEKSYSAPSKTIPKEEVISQKKPRLIGFLLGIIVGLTIATAILIFESYILFDSTIWLAWAVLAASMILALVITYLHEEEEEDEE